MSQLSVKMHLTLKSISLESFFCPLMGIEPINYLLLVKDTYHNDWTTKTRFKKPRLHEDEPVQICDITWVSKLQYYYVTTNCPEFVGYHHLLPGWHLTCSQKLTCLFPFKTFLSNNFRTYIFTCYHLWVMISGWLRWYVFPQFQGNFKESSYKKCWLFIPVHLGVLGKERRKYLSIFTILPIQKSNTCFISTRLEML